MYNKFYAAEFHYIQPCPFLYHRDSDISFLSCLCRIQIFVLTITRLNGDMNNSLTVVRLPIRKLGPHNSCGPIEVMTSKWFCFEEASMSCYLLILF